MDSGSGVLLLGATVPAMDVLLRADFVRAVGGRRAAARALTDGSWERVLRGTYAPAGDLDLAVRARACQLLLPEHALIADRCLLWLLGVDVLPPGPPQLEVVVPRGAVVPARTGVLSRTAQVAPHDRASLDGLRHLRPVRAAADLLRHLPPVEKVVVADAVTHAGLMTAEDLADELTVHAGLRGVRRARAALDRSDARAESPPETRLRVALVLAGLHPVPQHEVVVGGRFIARLDLAFPAARVAVEYDGRAVHERAEVFVHDRRRQNELVAAGWTVLRFTSEDLRWGAVRAVQVVQGALLARAA